MKAIKIKLTIMLICYFVFIAYQSVAQKKSVDSLNTIIDDRIEKLIKKKNDDNLGTVIETQANVASDLSNLLTGIGIVLTLVVTLASLIIFIFTMYYKKDIREKLKTSEEKIKEIEKIKEDFNNKKLEIDQEIKNIQQNKNHVENIARELDELRSRMKKSELKDKLYNSFSSDLLNRGVFPRKDLKTLETIVNLINELDNGEDKISSRDYYYKGLYCIGKKNYQEAIEELKKAISLSEPYFYFEAQDALSASYYFSRQYAEGINTLQKIYTHKKDDSIKINLIYGYIRNNQFDLAHQYSELLNKEDDNYLLVKAECYLREGIYFKALEWIQKTNSDKYHSLRGRILFHAAEYDRAIYQLSKKIEIIDKEISSFGSSEFDFNEKERLKIFKASIYILLSCIYLRKDKDQCIGEIQRSYFSALSINNQFSSLEGIENLGSEHRSIFTQMEKTAIKEAIEIAKS